MKHLLLLAVVTVAFQAIGTSAIDTILFKQHGSIQYSDDVLSNDIIEQLKLDMSLSEQQSHRGHITVDNNIFQRIKDAAGSAVDIDDIIDADTGGVKLQTRFIDQSTQPHVDRYHHNNEVVDDDVMFVALDSNPDAHFTHGDSSIPAVAGRLFRFNGSIKHRTTFNGGNPIRLLGPFSTKNFASVGVGCPADGICIDDANMITGVGTLTACRDGEECYEPFDDSTVGCPINGVCVTISGMTGVFEGIGDGNPCSNSDPDSDCYVCTSCSTKVFVTSETYQGDLGGISGADAKCQERACSAGLVGNYKAWLSDQTSNPANDFVQSASSYLVVINVPAASRIASDFADLTDGSLDRVINRDENGDIINSGNFNVWTNTKPDGSQNGSGDCNDWSSNDGSFSGQLGDINASDITWTNGQTINNPQSCDNFARLYCFQQDFAGTYFIVCQVVYVYVYTKKSLFVQTHAQHPALHLALR